MCRYRVGRRFALRVPLLPYEVIEAGRRDVADERARLSATIDRPEVSEAIFLASPTLYRKVDVWRAAPDSDDGCQIEWSLAKYVTRMASYPIPFGTFAGITTGEVDPDLAEQRPFRLGAVGAHGRKTRVDGALLYGLLAELPQLPGIRSRLAFRTNTSVTIAAGKLCYFRAEARPEGRFALEYSLVSVELTPYLWLVVEEAGKGAKLEVLEEALLREHPEVPAADAEAYLESLVDAQILVPEFGLRVTGLEPMEGAARQLAEAGLEEIARSLEEVRERLGQIDASGLGRSVSSYSAVVEALRQIWRMTRAKVAASVPGELVAERLFHLDLAMATAEPPVLGQEVVRAIERSVALLRRIAPRRRNPALCEFCDAFCARWDDREVPLLEALDEDVGLGFRPMAEDSPVGEGDRRAAWLLELSRRAGVERDREVVLDAGDLADLAHDIHEGRGARLPDAYAVTVRLGVSADERQIWLQHVTGPSGARSLGRFCHADSNIETMVRDHLVGEAAARPDVVFAEVVHLPDGRSADLLCRPVVRDHEIAYLGRGGAAADRRIDVRDLNVAVRHGRVVLRSRRLGREVVPRLTSAYGLARSPFAVCRFLAALQAQDVDSIGWSWGPLERFSWLPRVRIGDVVVAREQWRLGEEDVMQLDQAWAEKEIVARRRRVCDAVEAIRARRSLPRYLILIQDDRDGENGEFIDLEHRLLVQVFAAEVITRGRRLLTEVYPGPSASIVRGPEGHHASELVLTFVRDAHGAALPTNGSEPFGVP